MNRSNQLSILDFITSAGPIPQAVLATLLFCSVASWVIISHKVLLFRKADLANNRFRTAFLKSKTVAQLTNETKSFWADGPIGMLFGVLLEKIGSDSHSKKVLTEGDRRSIVHLERILKSGIQNELDYYEKHLHLLATIGNTTPFVGLFGTVVGIVDAFQAIGLEKSANISVVAPGIAEALIATAAGLAAAIPAVVAYNLFTNRLRRLEVKLEVFSSELIHLIETDGDQTSGVSRD
ncbi:MAG: MotA/TolQ/ExbB proton channel family protein [Nitrospirota bacterium]